MKKIMLVLTLLLAGCVDSSIEPGDDNLVPDVPKVEEPVVEVTVEGLVEELAEGKILINSEIGQIWFLSNSSINEIGVGDLINITYKDELAESSPMQGEMISYEMLQKYVAPTIDLSASEIIQNMIAESGAEFGGSMEDVITEDNQQWYLGALEYPEFLDTAVYTPMMNVDVSLIVVLKVNLEDVESLKETILASIDPNRLICVTFDLETDVVVDSFGDTVILVINKMYKDELHEAFIGLT